MDEPNVTNRRSHHGESATVLRRVRSMFTRRLSHRALIFTLVLATVSFLSVRHITPQPPYLRAKSHSYGLRSAISNRLGSVGNIRASLPTFWGSSHSNILSPFKFQLSDMPYSLYRTPFSRSSSEWRRPVSGLTIRDPVCGSPVEDFVVTKEAYTFDCYGGRSCRARAIVTKQGSDITIQVGYNIGYSGGAIGIDSRTKRNVKAVTRAEANKWAKSLLKQISPSLEGQDCEVTVKMISDAIMLTKKDAARCPRTDNPLCSQLETVQTCAAFVPPPPETEKQRECIEFLKSSPSISSLDDLVAKSPCNVSFEYNVVYVNVPLCITTCVSGGCEQEKTVFADLDVSGSMLFEYARWDKTDNIYTRNAIAIVFVSLYNEMLASNIPSCDNMPYVLLEDEFGEGDELLVARHKPSPYSPNIPYLIPTEFQDIAAEYKAKLYDVSPNAHSCEIPKRDERAFKFHLTDFC
ncbi:hypothetical protein FGB62_312g010 [Gracilaria domingensis]|nr:hypothetical protein FGB62_312g010 [Gracilaria domingensis]